MKLLQNLGLASIVGMAVGDLLDIRVESTVKSVELIDADGRVNKNNGRSFLPNTGAGPLALRSWQDIHHYGCWCYFDNYIVGRYKAVDQIDRYCKDLHANYLCIRKKYAAQGEVCEAEKEYFHTPGLTRSVSQGVLFSFIYGFDAAYTQDAVSRSHDYCRHINGPNESLFGGSEQGPGGNWKSYGCRTDACLAEVTFEIAITPLIVNVFPPFTGGANPAFMHATTTSPRGPGSFDPAVSCVPNPGAVIKSCCGENPWFRVYNVNKVTGSTCKDARGDYHNTASSFW